MCLRYSLVRLIVYDAGFSSLINLETLLSGQKQHWYAHQQFSQPFKVLRIAQDRLLEESSHQLRSTILRLYSPQGDKLKVCHPERIRKYAGTLYIMLLPLLHRGGHVT